MEIGKALDECLDPLGVAVIMECRHMCMEMRGVQKTGASTRTQFRCGVFASPRYWTEFECAVHGGKRSRTPCLVPPTVSTHTLSTTTSTSSCNDPKANDTTEESSSAMSMDASTVATEADNYRLYQSCAKNEVEVMTTIIIDSMRGPSLGQKPEYLSWTLALETDV